MGSAVLRSPFFPDDRHAIVHLATLPRWPSQSRGSTRPADRRGAMSAQISQRLFYGDGPVAGPRFPKPASGVRFPVDVPSLCRPAAGLHAASVRTRVRIPAQGPFFFLLMMRCFLRAWPIGRGTGFPNRVSGFDSRSTVQCPRHLTDRIRDYESRHGGSNPPEGATLFCDHLLRSSNG